MHDGCLQWDGNIFDVFSSTIFLHYQEFNNFLFCHSFHVRSVSQFALFDDQKCQINLSGTVISHIFF